MKVRLASTQAHTCTHQSFTVRHKFCSRMAYTGVCFINLQFVENLFFTRRPMVISMCFRPQIFRSIMCGCSLKLLLERVTAFISHGIHCSNVAGDRYRHVMMMRQLIPSGVFVVKQSRPLPRMRGSVLLVPSSGCGGPSTGQAQNSADMTSSGGSKWRTGPGN
jgi:hypothetical protein